MVVSDLDVKKTLGMHCQLAEHGEGVVVAYTPTTATVQLTASGKKVKVPWSSFGNVLSTK